MTLNQFLIPPILSFFLFNLAFVLGYFVLGKIRARRGDFLFNLGYSVLLGYGILGYFALILSYLRILNKVSIFVFALIVFLLGCRSLFYFYRNLRELLQNIVKQNLLNKILFGVLIFLIVFASLSAYMPPYRGDVIIYHLPEVESIAKDGIFSEGWYNTTLNLPEPWVSALPLLMETIYAVALTIYGFTLVHLVHYQIFLALILAVYVFLRKKFTKTYGLLGCILIFSIFEIVVNSTVAYVDAAMVSFGIAGLLIFMDWFFSNRKSSLILSALLFGFAAAIKYIAFYNLIIIGLFFLAKVIFIDKKKIWEIAKVGSLFLGFWLISGGFWYLKNLVLYGSPICPYFSTPSYLTPSASYEILVETFSSSRYPKTFFNFLAIPFIVFREPHYYPILLGFISLPFVFLIRKFDLIRKNKKVIIFLFIYLFSYFFLWFFIGPQHRRYGMDGQVVLMILTAIILGAILIRLLEKIRLIWLVILAFSVIICLSLIIGNYENNYLFEYEKMQMEYFIGIKNEADFYQFQNYGEEFFVADYINKNLKNEKILYNICAHEASFFLKKGNQFVPFRFLNVNKNKGIWLQLKVDDIHYLLLTWQGKEKHYCWRTGACTLNWERYKNEILPIENLIKEHSELVFSDEEKGVELYRINLEQIWRTLFQ